jgi:hypothetical protein
MRENFFRLLNSLQRDCFVSRDKSLGQRADALAPCFLLAPRLFHHDTKLRCHLSGLATVSQLHRDPKLTAIYRDWQKTRHRDTDGT